MKNIILIIICIVLLSSFKSHKSNWDLLIESMIYVESRNNDTIRGQTNDVGCLQITPIYVTEANRISKKKFTLKDRLSRSKSIEMFNIMQNYYNKEKNPIKACKLHNPGASSRYIMEIITLYLQKIHKDEKY